MKICLDARVVIDEQTGLGNYTYNLLKHLLAIDKKNIYLVLLNKFLRKDHPILELKHANLHQIFLDIPGVTWQQQFLVPIHLIKNRPDIYHYPNFDLPVFQPFNSVFTVHDLTYLKHRSLYVNGRTIKNYYTSIIMILGAKKAAKIIAVSESTKQDLIDLLKIPPQKIETIHEGIDGSFLNGHAARSLAASPNRATHAIGADKYFLFIGERRPHKNLVRLIEAFFLFKKKCQNRYKLVIGGKRYASYDAPERKVQELGLMGEVIFMGYVDESDLSSIYRQAEAFIFPSIYEGFGLPILEAMACEVPVITANLSSMPEIADHSAILVNPYDTNEIAEAMLSIVKNPKLKGILIERGKRKVKEFSWAMAAERTLRVYEDVAAKSK